MCRLTLWRNLPAGSAGAAISLAEEDGPKVYATLLDLIGSAPQIDRAAAVKFAEHAAQRGKEARRDLTLRLIDLALARLAKTGAGTPPMVEAAPKEIPTLSRLSPDPAAGRKWATLQQELGQRAGHGLAVNLDPSSLILDMILKINETAAAILARQ